MKNQKVSCSYVVTDIHKHKTTIWAGRKIPPGYAESLAMNDSGIDYEHSKCQMFVSVDNKIIRSEIIWDRTHSDQLTLFKENA